MKQAESDYDASTSFRINEKLGIPLTSTHEIPIVPRHNWFMQLWLLVLRKMNVFHQNRKEFDQIT
uniref:Uncharacterized protein n=1 Tax=Arundo donax TaxID=35708 RepID=A0A0A8ZSP8_ARUDO